MATNKEKPTYTRTVDKKTGCLTVVRNRSTPKTGGADAKK